MDFQALTPQLIAAGLSPQQTSACTTFFTNLSKHDDAAALWQAFQHSEYAAFPFPIHWLIFTTLFKDWRENPSEAYAWQPTPQQAANSNLGLLLQAKKWPTAHDFYSWSCAAPDAYWQLMIERLNIQFKHVPSQVWRVDDGVENIRWLPNASMNIVDSCFQAPADQTAVIYRETDNTLTKLTYGELHSLVNRIANGLIDAGFKAGDAIAIVMPMHYLAVASYLAIVKLGAAVVSIADSFSAEEMATRLKIAAAKGIITQYELSWDGKKLPLYSKIAGIENAPRMIVLHDAPVILRQQDLAWNDFLSAQTDFTSHAAQAMDTINILFSSGTTASPKAIPWNHTTPIKAASDAHLHQNIQPNDVLAWPTNLGWMMGPWLIFAALMNRACLALYTDAPRTTAFGQFIEDAGVTMLGVVPTLVAYWRQSQCMEKCNWQRIKVFSSTGECSNPHDMFYLMWLGGYKPVIEYCGGTEIGGAYLSSTVIEPNCPSIFTTPTMGTALMILNEEAEPAEQGEVALIPPIMGLSTTLLNADHHQVYYAHMPSYHNMVLRRHGDEIKRYKNGYYSIQGRADDAMNLGGIKISAAEIERTLSNISGVQELAAIAVSPPENGPSQLIIFALTSQMLDANALRQSMQQRINKQLNPLFKIHQVVIMENLPKTASNKIMRRKLREQYTQQLLS